MQDSHSGPQPASRRGFFFGAATVGAAAAAVTVLPKVVETPAASAAPDLKPAPEKGGGYSLSEHVKRYYKTTSA
ncbi:formate dehydrogenase [Variovorax sp. J22R24]|uniref:formate dehydrogenase n=1 Tax=Variovorax gracilis TaxID=3053502 RepID=UPI0025777A94|nr:formate dehydrogenase [Variovorax sp. J22R24]MDM0106400.1 formate dehydrogenase [Variovorax sp. J22R24]